MPTKNRSKNPSAASRTPPRSHLDEIPNTPIPYMLVVQANFRPPQTRSLSWTFAWSAKHGAVIALPPKSPPQRRNEGAAA
jgi:hypothetical protein